MWNDRKGKNFMPRPFHCQRHNKKAESITLTDFNSSLMSEIFSSPCSTSLLAWASSDWLLSSDIWRSDICDVLSTSCCCSVLLCSWPCNVRYLSDIRVTTVNPFYMYFTTVSFLRNSQSWSFHKYKTLQINLLHAFRSTWRRETLVKKIVAAFRGMHVSPVKHSFGKCDRRTDRRTDGRTDKVIPMCLYASQAIQ